MKKLIILTFAVLFTTVSCDNPLEEKFFTELSPDNFFQNEEDAETALIAAYANAQGYLLRDYLTFGEFTTDIAIERQGAINAFTQPVEDFRWDASHQWLLGLWGRYYSAIFRANIVLDNVPLIDSAFIDVDRKEQILAEARFLRAFNYFYLYDLFGPTPLIVTSNTLATDRPFRATKEEFIKFVEDEFLAASEGLPATQSQYPRATRGAALGFLTKFYLNNKKWAEAAETAKKIIDSNVHAIFQGNSRTDLFALANEQNSEFIYVAPFHVYQSGGANIGNTYLSHAAPPGYRFQFPPKVNFAAQFKILSAFINTFDAEDERLGAFVFQYTNLAGNPVVLGVDDVRSFKYSEDPGGIGDVGGNDFPLLRYADILLSRAEALNELNGPNQESIDLINEVREAAGINLLGLSDFSDTGELRDHILAERGWEFHTEGLRRQDLIRHGRFIERAKAAFDYQVFFPIPQREIDANENLEQNDGY